jgi:hypothetical protein
MRYTKKKEIVIYTPKLISLPDPIVTLTAMLHATSRNSVPLSQIIYSLL